MRPSEPIHEESAPPPEARPGPAPWLIALVVAAALGWMLLFTVSFQTSFGLYWFSFIGPAWGFIGAGLVTWSRRPENRIGRLMTLTGFLLLLPTLSASQIPILFTIGSMFSDAAAPALFYLVLSYPRGSLFTRPSWGLFWTVVAFAAAFDLGLLPWFDPRDFGCTDCPPGLNLLLFERNPNLVATAQRILALVVFGAMSTLVGTLISRWVRATGPSRAILWPVYLPAAAFALFQAYFVADSIVLQGAFPGFNRILPYIQPAVLTLLPVTFLLGLLRLRARRTRVGDLVAELAPAPTRAGDEVARRPAPRAWLAVIAVAAIGYALALRLSVDLPIDAMVEGLAFVAAGIASWILRPENRTGKLLIAYGVLIWGIHLQGSGVPILWTFGPLMFVTAIGAVLIYAILAFPEGRLGSWFERALFALSAVNVVWQGIGMMLFNDPRQLGCADCAPGLNLLLIRGDPDLFFAMAKWNPVWISLVMIPLAVLLVMRLVRATPPSRRVIWPMVIPALAFILANRVVGLTEYFSSLTGSSDIFASPPRYFDVLRGIEQAAIIALPFTFLFGLFRLRARRTRVGDLIVEARRPASGPLREAVARALGDPSAEVGVYAAGTYRGADGAPIELPGDASHRTATFLERDGDPLAVIVHDRALLEDPKLLNSVRAATGLAVENELLTAEVRAQLEDVRASRARIVAAADQERRRLERDIHDGVQQHLVAIGAKVRAAQELVARDPGQAREMLEEISEQTTETLASLRDLARGIYPPLLGDRGLVQALRAHIRKTVSPTRMEASIPDDMRFDPEVEAAVYFCVLEALQNAAKHAPDALAEVRLVLEGDELVFEVVDEGPGFDPDARTEGTGLQNMADRVAALGGTQEIRSGPGEGTAIRGRLPAHVIATS